MKTLDGTVLPPETWGLLPSILKWLAEFTPSTCRAHSSPHLLPGQLGHLAHFTPQVRTTETSLPLQNLCVMIHGRDSPSQSVFMLTTQGRAYTRHVFLPPAPSQSSKIQILTLFCLPLHSHFSSPTLVLILFLLPQLLLLLLFCFVFGCSSNKTNLLLLRPLYFSFALPETFDCISKLNLLLKSLVKETTLESKCSQAPVVPLSYPGFYFLQNTSTPSVPHIYVMCVCVCSQKKCKFHTSKTFLQCRLDSSAFRGVPSTQSVYELNVLAGKTG